VNPAVADQFQRLGIEHEHRVAGMVGDHIGEILDRGNDHGYSYLVYPLYQPGSLEKFCQRADGRLTLEWCARIIDEVLSGLITASAHNLVHLDIKPGNIVLDGARARIIDWGLSRKWDATSTWVLRGTPFFACPEQLTSLQQGRERWDTPTADLYGVGATFYRLITGEPPFQHEVEEDGGHYPLEVYVRLLLQGFSPQPVHELVPGVPPELGLLIQRWMSLEPAHRVPPAVPRTHAAHAAREELSALRPYLPNMIVGRVTGRRRPR
jgi:serine/threonine-protein kinase